MIRLTTLAAVVCVLGLMRAQAAEQASVLVSTIMPHRGTVPEIVTAYGSAVPAPGTAITLSLPRAGQVRQVFAEAGAAVALGERLIVFAASPAAVQAYNQAVAALALAQNERAHTAQLLSQQLATRSQLAQADKAVADARAALEAQKREGGGDTVQTLTAPVDGIVTTTLVKPGERVAADAPLLTIASQAGIALSAGIEPAARQKVHPGQRATLQPLQGGGPAVSGILRQVDAMLDPKTRQIGILIAPASGSLIPGAAYKADITVGMLSGWPVPRDAVLSGPTGAYVFQIGGQKARRVNVKIVGTFGETTVVEGPLDASQPLVIQGNYELTDGEAVRESPAAASQS